MLECSSIVVCVDLWCCCTNTETHTHTDARTLDTAHRIIACTHTSSTSVLAVALCFTGFFYDFIASQLLVFHALCSWLVARNKTIYRFWLFIYLFGYLSLLLSFFWLVFWVLNFPAEIPEKPNKYTDTADTYMLVDLELAAAKCA